MIEPAPLLSKQRRIQDIAEIEYLGQLFTQLELNIEPGNTMNPYFHQPPLNISNDWLNWQEQKNSFQPYLA